MLDNTGKLQALSRAAKRRRTSYGKLTIALTQDEEQQIYDQYERDKHKKKKKE